MLDPRAKITLDYWFGADLEQTAAYFRERSRLWFMGGAEVDEEIRRRFLTDVELAARGKLSAWSKSARGSIALIVLLDQFSLNIYRNQAEGYRNSELAIPVAKALLDSGEDAALTPAEKIFLYMPLEHSEELGDQERSVRLFRALAENAPASLKEMMKGNLDYAIRHFNVVQEFGRFPHRNQALLRMSTEKEIAFLVSRRAPF